MEPIFNQTSANTATSPNHIFSPLKKPTTRSTTNLAGPEMLNREERSVQDAFKTSANESEHKSSIYDKFVSRGQVEEPERQDPVGSSDAGVQDDRPLYEILKEKQELKKQEEESKYNPHMPPKAIDEDEALFLEEEQNRKREAEAERKKELDNELAAFRQSREALDKAVVRSDQVTNLQSLVLERRRVGDGSTTKPVNKKNVVSIVKIVRKREAGDSQSVGRNPESNKRTRPTNASRPESEKKGTHVLGSLAAYSSSSSSESENS